MKKRTKIFKGLLLVAGAACLLYAVAEIVTEKKNNYILLKLIRTAG